MPIPENKKYEGTAIDKLLLQKELLKEHKITIGEFNLHKQVLLSKIKCQKNSLKTILIVAGIITLLIILFFKINNVHIWLAPNPQKTNLD